MKHVYALNAHASFACRHSGACCTAGWAIPVEIDKRPIIPVEWLTPDDTGVCPQFDRTSRLCRIHRDHGERHMPESCRHFPRRALIDDRGTFLTLSHFCPTASRLLVDSCESLAVICLESGDAGRTYDGLDARGDWPPLLRPGVLFDYESFDEWSTFVIATLGASRSPASALTHVAAVAERLCAWHVSAGPLAQWTHESVSRPVTTDELRNAERLFMGSSRLERYKGVCRTVPAGLDVPPAPHDLESETSSWLAHIWNSDAAPAGRYLAAKAFAAWTPYQSRDLRTHVAELCAAEAVLFTEVARVCARTQSPLDRHGWIEAIRASDWLLMHLSDRGSLMEWLKETET